MVHGQAETHVKVLQRDTVFCQERCCDKPATHLFRGGTITAYCESHAKAEASRIGIDLPMAVTESPRIPMSAQMPPSTRLVSPRVVRLFLAGNR